MKIKITDCIKLTLVVCLLSISSVAFSAGKSGGSLLAPLNSMIDDYLRADQDVNLDLFVMSQCPFGVEAEKELAPFLKEYNGKVKFNLYFVAGERDGKFVSMHGDAEVEEDMRQMVISKLYPSKLLDYLVARGENGAKGDWTQAAAGLGIDVKKVNKELSKASTKKAFQKNIQRCKTDGISQSPYLLVNNQHYEGALLAFAGSGDGCNNEVAIENAIAAPEPFSPPPADSATCGSQKYSKKNQDCLTCGGIPTVVAKGTDCCTGVLYDHACFRCKDGQVVGKCPPGHICCDGNCSINNTQTCLTCNGRNVLVNPGQKCCNNGQIYNSNDSDCVKCGNVYMVLPKGQQCCNGVPYDTRTKDCITCLGVQQVVPKGYSCCLNGQVYDPKVQDCIKCGSNYQLVPKGGDCCSGTPYDKKCFRCQDGVVVSKCPPGHLCCDGNCGTKDEYICTTTKTVVTCAGSTTTTTPFVCSNTYTPPPCQTTGQLTYSQGVCVGGTVVTICYSGPVRSVCP